MTKGLKVEVDVLIRFPEDVNRSVTSQDAAIMVTNVRKALEEIYPNHVLRGLWVHETLPRDRDRNAAVRLILEALKAEAQDDPSAYVLRAADLAEKLLHGD
jgi:hypothetical protein